MNEDIKVTFIIPKYCRSENDCSEEMQLAFTACEQHSGGGLQAEWVQETQYNKFEGLTKRDVFVLTDFDGDLYEKLRTTKCLLVGPRCLSCCLTEGEPIPSGPEPVFTVAMRGLVVTASGMTKLQKEKIKKKVFWMGGMYNAALTDDTTHLVSDTVLSDKYIKSIEKGIPVMSESWIDAVWDASLRLNINGSSSEFAIHRLPPFANLQITTSGISKKDKQLIMKLVNENGGSFSGAFQSETTDIVVLTKDGVGSDKYKAALEYSKACVLPSWIKDSAAMGIALPISKYRVAGASTSSPLAEHRLPDMSLNFSRITNVRPPTNFVDETRATDMSAFSGRTKLSQDPKKNDLSVDKEIVAAFVNFDMSAIKKAGPIFDGFCIWVTGLEGQCRERAVACVSRAGGVRMDSAHARVTHVVAGGRAAAKMAAIQLPAVPVLSPLWLVKSVLAGRALDETEFVIDPQSVTPPRTTTEPASPMSKRNIQLLRRERPPSSPAPPPPPVEEADELVNHYLSQHLPPEPEREKTPEPAPNARPSKSEVTNMTDDLTDEVEQIFRGIKIEVQGLDEESVCEIGAEVSAAGGVLVAVGAGGSHVLVPLDFDAAERLTANAEAVTVFWVKDCLSQQELVPIQYYHRPVKLPIWGSKGAPLTGVVASLSTYSGVERAFLDELAQLLGATTQLRFCRRNTANSQASTHLICPTAAGDKYAGAVKWGLPAVTADWLMECARRGRRVSEREYLVGDTKAPSLPETVEEMPPAAAEPIEKENMELQMRPPSSTAVPRRGSIPSREDTPKTNKGVDGGGDNEMSPASRYIAMARQGLLGCDSQETPKRVQVLRGDAKQEAEGALRTPPLDEALSTPNLRGLSPTTRRRIQAVRRGEMPSDPIKTPADPFEKVPTPDSAFGAALRPGAGRMSPDARKRLWQLVDELPGREDDAPHKAHTPLSEIRNRFLAQFNSDAPAHTEHNMAPRKLHLQEQADTPPAKMAKHSIDQSAGRLPTLQQNESSKKFKTTEETSKNPASGISARTHESSDYSAGIKNSKDVSKNASSGSGIHPSSDRSAGLRSDSRNLSNNTSSHSAGIHNSSDNNVSKGSSSGHPSSNSSAATALPAAVDAQLQRLSAALSGLATQRARRATRDSIPRPIGPESEPGPESQPNTVGWDDTTPGQPAEPSPPAEPLIKRFMLSSNVDNREEVIEMIAYLGGEVCEGTELDPEATHLLCAAPGRSEKMLGSVAAGRWVLHPAYIARSRARGAFLPEEEFEWGNPLATCLPTVSGAERPLALAAHRWRSARAAGRPGPFAGVVALLHVPPPRRRLLARLVVAGDGLAPEDQPPYNNEDVTVCFADIRRYPLSERDGQWLKARRIPVCPPVLLSSYLTDEVPPSPEQHCLPEYRP